MATTTAVPALPEPDTRSRILAAAQRLFRKRGYHATGLSDILELAQAPKGSLYHHFPGGKEEIGVCVVADMAQGLLQLLAGSRARTTEAILLQVGKQLKTVVEKTDFEICTLFAAFTAERKTSPELGQAVANAYTAFAAAIETRLLADGFTARAAHETALTVTALIEGGSMLSQVHRDSTAFRLSVKQAAALCKAPVKKMNQRPPRAR
jgi:TetR/AcrR family transcriptional regulator, lmrAB and yxaGH operons repressor